MTASEVQFWNSQMIWNKIHLKYDFIKFNLTSHSSFYKEINLKLEEILGRLKLLAKQKDLLGLKESSGGEKPSPKRPTTSLVEESGV